MTLQLPAQDAGWNALLRMWEQLVDARDLEELLIRDQAAHLATWRHATLTDPAHARLLQGEDRRRRPALGGGPRSRVLPLTPTLFDGPVWAAVGQQVTFTFACELRWRLLTAVGEWVSADLTGLGFARASRPRGPHPASPIPGFGPWSVQYVLLRALNLLDACPVSDAALRRASRHTTPFPPRRPRRSAQSRTDGAVPWPGHPSLLATPFPHSRRLP